LWLFTARSTTATLASCWSAGWDRAEQQDRSCCAALRDLDRRTARIKHSPTASHRVPLARRTDRHGVVAPESDLAVPERLAGVGSWRRHCRGVRRAHPAGGPGGAGPPPFFPLF